MIDVHQSMDPNTDKVFHKLLMSFHMQKKNSEAYNQMFNQGIFFGGGGVGVQSDFENCAYL